MRSAARILGIVGGILGLLAAFGVLFFGGLGQAFGALGAGIVVDLGWLALIASIVGIVGGVLAISKPALAGALMLVGGVLGFIAITLFWVPSGLLLIAGAILAFIGRRG